MNFRRLLTLKPTSSQFLYLAVIVTMVLMVTMGQSLAQSKKKPAGVSCILNGKTYKNCSPAMLKQAKREAARIKAAPQKKGVTVQFAGISPATVTKSPLAPTTALGKGATVAALAAFGTQPDYFAIGNYANSPLPQVDATGTIVPLTGMRKFVNSLPGLCGLGAPNRPGAVHPPCDEGHYRHFYE